jgi:U3 small nucleolar RNA-associated protein 14
MLCTNHYSHCNNNWQLDDCDSFHNDECETCKGEITSSHSVEWTKDGAKHHYHDSNISIELSEWLTWCDRVSKAAHGKEMFLLVIGENEARKTAMACFENGERPNTAVDKNSPPASK